MSVADWIVLGGTLIAIILYGIWKSRGQKDMAGYFLDNQSMPWYIVLLSIIGTQASAVTFLSAPGQAYTDGMRFVQYYFGLPLAMVVICIAFVPIYHKLKVFTAYEYLEQRFDCKTRTFTAILFLLQRALSTGISIYAPAIILSSLLGWNIAVTNVIMGGLLIIYTVSGGTRAVSYTQTIQLAIIFIGMFLAGYMVVHLLPEGVGFNDALRVAGHMGKLNVIETKFDWKDKYNIWSGLIGGFFLALSYFGTDQSQVGRYLTAKSVKESRMGLLMNGLVKIPMQFLILLIGALVFVFYMFFKSPIYFNEAQMNKLQDTKYAKSLLHDQQQYEEEVTAVRQEQVRVMAEALRKKDKAALAVAQERLNAADEVEWKLRNDVRDMMRYNDPAADTNDTNYIFLYFVVNNLPRGAVGLLIAIIFLAAWGSIAAALNSLASTTVIDIYKRQFKPTAPDEHYMKVSRWWTFIWGLFCILVAQFASKLGSLIEAVNVLGSLFYGVILGIFLVAFYCKRIGGSAVFWAAIISEIGVLYIWQKDIVSFLWLNAIGCLLVIVIAWILHFALPVKQRAV